MAIWINEKLSFYLKEFPGCGRGGEDFSKVEGTENSNSPPVLFDITGFAGCLVDVNPPNPSTHCNCTVPLVCCDVRLREPWNSGIALETDRF